MNYSTLQTIAIVCYMLSAGLLVVSVLIFFLLDMKTIIGRITGASQRRALARMRSGGAVGKTGETVIDMSVLEKRGATSGSLNTAQRHSRRTGKGLQSKSGKIPSTPTPAHTPTPTTTPNYFGAPYPNKTPPAPVTPAPSPPPPPAPEQQITVMSGAAPPGEGTMDLDQWQQSQQQPDESGTALLVEDDTVEPVKMTILDDIVLLHTEHFIEI